MSFENSSVSYKTLRGVLQNFLEWGSLENDRSTKYEEAPVEKFLKFCKIMEVSRKILQNFKSYDFRKKPE